MRFLILGATGPSGIAFVYKTLEVYPTASIVIYARNPSKLPADLSPTQHPALSIIQGELTELDKVAAALAGVDVVLSALGPAAGHTPDTPLARFHEALLDLMHTAGVTRGVFLSTASYPDKAHDRPSWKFAALVAGVRTFFPAVYRDIVATAEAVVRKGGEYPELEWTLVRVPFLTNAETEDVVAGYVGDGKTGMVLARKAYAAFVVGEVGKREWVNKAPLISNP